MKLSDIVHCVVIDPRKLTHYALDPDAPWGRHKAMVFKRSLGFTQANYADLLIQIEKKALESEAFFHSVDKFGRRYTVDLFICGPITSPVPFFRELERPIFLVRYVVFCYMTNYQ